MTRPVSDLAGFDQPLQNPPEVLRLVVRDLEMLGDRTGLHRPIAGRGDEFARVLPRVKIGMRQCRDWALHGDQPVRRLRGPRASL